MGKGVSGETKNTAFNASEVRPYSLSDKRLSAGILAFDLDQDLYPHAHTRVLSIPIGFQAVIRSMISVPEQIPDEPQFVLSTTELGEGL